jgi:outer membrane protein assembly factor BamB
MFAFSKAVLALGLLSLASPAFAIQSDWTTLGGNDSRDGVSTARGPDQPNVLWSGTLPTWIADPVFVEGTRVFTARVDNAMLPTTKRVVCYDLNTGVELWQSTAGTGTENVRIRCLGVRNGRLIVATQLYSIVNALDVIDGAVLWSSPNMYHLSGPAAAAFAPNGDPIVGAADQLVRFNILDGTEVWSAPHPSMFAGQQNVAIRNGALYALGDFGLGNAICRLDLATGAILYATPLPNPVGGGSVMVGPGGQLFFTQVISPAPPQHDLTAWQDTGSAFVQQWSRRTSTASVPVWALGVGNTIYHVNEFAVVERLDRATGAAQSQSTGLGTTPGSTAELDNVRLAVDSAGRVFATSGSATVGKVWSFNADLSLRWSFDVPGVTYANVAIASAGTLLTAGTGTTFYALRSEATNAQSLCFGDGSDTSCPCGAGAPGRGCPNSVEPAGALLEALGTASVTNDVLSLSAHGMPSSTALFLQGASSTAPGAAVPFGDGLRCALPPFVRLATRQNAAGASRYPLGNEPRISAQGQVPLQGGTRTYQVFYRNAANFCTAATMNSTNAVSVVWSP